MASRRTLKAAQAVREVVSMAILADLKDPRNEGVTVTYVEVSADMRLAKVHVSVMGDESHQKLCLHGLQSAAGYLQQKVAKRIDTRYTPRIQFLLDMGVKKSIAIARLLGDVLPDDVSPNEALAADASAEDPSAEIDSSSDLAGDVAPPDDSPATDSHAIDSQETNAQDRESSSGR
ncbi:MAG: 30S ribosome-binding factor RbfA [Planctomycetales bacterium]|nr:30S ribosome-binding factor RbfA [Planctomycetales bacterium]